MTKKRPLIDKLLHNWPVKIVCLVIAIFLYIFHQASLIGKSTLVVPLTIVENGIVMHVGNVPAAVSVSVRANANDINSIHNSDINAVINLDSLTEKGTYKLPVNISIQNRLFEIDPLEIKVKDEFVVVDVDRKATKYVTLLPSVVGEVAHGFAVSEIQMNPSSVEINGPETVLNAINNLNTTKINISNAETTFTTEAYLIDNSSIYSVDNKGPYRITVVVNAIDHEADFVDVVPKLLNLSENLVLNSILSPVNVRLAGSMKNLEEYIPSEDFVRIDCKSVTEPGEYELPLVVNAPVRFKVINISTPTQKFLFDVKQEIENPEEDNGELVLNDSDNNALSEKENENAEKTNFSE